MKKIITLSLLVMMGFSLLAQHGQDRRKEMEERVRAMRVAFITQKLALTPEESQDFWPVYNELTDALEELRREGRQMTPVSEMSNDEAEAFIDRVLSIQTRELSLKKDYLERLKQLIPIQKVAMLHFVEREFKQEILDRVRERSDERSKRGRRKN